MVASSCCLTSFRRRSQSLEPNIIDARVSKACGENIFGKARTSGQWNSADVSHQSDISFFQSGYEFCLGRAFIADRENPHRLAF